MSTLGRVAILGSGQIGTMLGKALRSSRRAAEVAIWDRDAVRLRAAMALGAGDRPLAGEDEALDSEVLVLALPVAEIVGRVEVLGPRLGPGQFLIDSGSAKLEVVEAMARRVSGSALAVGGHPICGSEGSGPWSADPERLRGATFALTPVREQPGALERAFELVRALGARPLVLSAAEHDRILARTSHLPHLVAAAISRVCAEIGRAGELSGTGLLSATRLADSDPEMVASFLLANRTQVTLAVGALVRELQSLAQSDHPALVEKLEAARAARADLESRSA